MMKYSNENGWATGTCIDVDESSYAEQNSKSRKNESKCLISMKFTYYVPGKTAEVAVFE